jgi:hypothetical protein
LLVSDDLLHVSLRVINGEASGDQWRSFWRSMAKLLVINGEASGDQ